MWEIPAAVLAGAVVAAVGTPAGVSGAVFLLPVQISVLGVVGPAVSATNLLFNIVSTPLALLRIARRAAWNWTDLRLVIVVGTPAAVVGATARVTVLADPAHFRLVMAIVLLPLGVRLLWRAWQHRSSPMSHDSVAQGSGVRPAVLCLLIALAAAVGGVLGIGGGSVLAPLLVGIWRVPTRSAAVISMATTLTTSVTGLAAYTLLDAADIGAAPAAPFWLIGLALGVGGMIGSLAGSALQRHISDRFLVTILDTLATCTGLSYLPRS